jgi:hypothetical protein
VVAGAVADSQPLPVSDPDPVGESVAEQDADVHERGNSPSRHADPERAHASNVIVHVDLHAPGSHASPSVKLSTISGTHG